MATAESQACASHPWAVDLVDARFQRGLENVFNKAFVESRFDVFVARSDPVYATLLQGISDERVARVMVGNWIVAHTMATQSRFWLEDAIVDLLYARCAREPLPQLRPRIYSLHMLAEGWYSNRKSLWDAGEQWREQLHGTRAWHPLIQEQALREIDMIVGDETRAYDTSPVNRGDQSLQMSQEADQAALDRAASALGGSAKRTTIRCNLLFIEPEVADHEPHAWGIRYINPTTFNQGATIKEERMNLLRLRAYLAQEKPFRAPGKVRVVAADLVPRSANTPGREAALFSPLTRWTGHTLWDFLQVPFAAVTAGIRRAGAAMEAQLREELTRLHAATP